MAIRLQDLNERQRKAVIEQAEEYLKTQVSDPFARDRVYSHLRNGIAIFFGEKGEGLICAYSAKDGQNIKVL